MTIKDLRGELTKALKVLEQMPDDMKVQSFEIDPFDYSLRLRIINQYDTAMDRLIEDGFVRLESVTRSPDAYRDHGTRYCTVGNLYIEEMIAKESDDE